MRPGALVLALVCVLAFCEPALARSNSGGSSSSHSHSSAGKSRSGYIVRHCKTEACLKKHPSGTYGFMPGEHKRKD